ncbi:MAG TPA: N,N-dimethylformamidase beta subunit family domain-containing protein [Gaiellaceae bacterium]|nr:N,N-dimethylformamidase beta subunit family domain-containing protein [Gaiellaceae bacterium]
MLATGSASGRGDVVPFVVRPGPSAAGARILVVAPVNTWQAYNTWGGKSLYVNLLGPNAKAYARAVSFDRPYDAYTSRMLLYWEYPLVRFLERNGYDVAYETDVDVDRDPAALSGHALVVVAGHSEYWTPGMRDAFEAARAAGTNLAFVGGNDGYWQARYADARRTLLEYRSAQLDPSPAAATKTVRFRDLQPPRPECSLVGVEWQGGWESNGLAPAYTVVPSSLREPWFRGTGFTGGGTLPGLVGYEWDAVEPSCPVPPLTVYFHYQGKPAPPNRSPFTHSWYSTNADVVSYTAPSGARVFATGSIQFSWGLDGFARTLHAGIAELTDRYAPDPRLQRFMRNVFDDLSTPTGLDEDTGGSR